MTSTMNTMSAKQDYETIVDILTAMRKREEIYFDYHSPSRNVNHDNDWYGYEESYNDDPRLGAKSKAVRSRRNMTTTSMTHSINYSQSQHLDRSTNKIRNRKRSLSCKKPLRCGIVDFVFQAVDYYDENREVAQVTMNLIDRLLALPSLPLLTTSKRSDCEYGYDQRGPDSESSSDCSVGSNYASCSIDWNAIILLCLDLAIKIFSPTSGSGHITLLNSNSNNSNNFKSTRLSPPETNETRSRTPYITDSYRSIAVIMGGSSSHDIYANGNSDYHDHRSSSYTTAQLSTMQIQICKSLSFHLNPPTCAAFIQYLLHLVIRSPLSHSGSSDRNHSDDDSDDVSMIIPSSLQHDIADAAYMQVELSVFDDEDHYFHAQGSNGLSCVKSSILASAALLNASTQLLPHDLYHQHHANRNSYHETGHNDSNKENINNISQFDTTTTGTPSASRFKFHLRKIIQSVLYLDPKSVDMLHIRCGLFDLWKENNPDMIRCDDLDLIGTTIASSLYADCFNKKEEVLHLDEKDDEEVEQVEWRDEESDDKHEEMCTSDPPMLRVEEVLHNFHNNNQQGYENDITLEKDGMACTPTLPSSLLSLPQDFTHPISISSCTPVLSVASSTSTNGSIRTKRQKKNHYWVRGG